MERAGVDDGGDLGVAVASPAGSGGVLGRAGISRGASDFFHF